MNIEYFSEPVPHIVIRNVFSTVDLEEIWKELVFLTCENKLQPPSKTMSAKVNGQAIKNNHGIFLEYVYTSPEYSNIFNATRKLFTKELLDEIASKNCIFEYLKLVNNESFLLSYYENNDSYLPHKDNSVFTVVINLYKEPKAFNGGDLTLGNATYKIPLENNRLVLFPSWAIHSVTPIKFTEPYKKFSGLGRYTLSDFLYINNIKGQKDYE